MAGQRWDRDKLLIGGEWREAKGGTYDIINPSTEEVVGVAPEATREDAFEAAAAAKEAFWTWSQSQPAERAEILRRAGELLAKHNDELVPLVQAETGATMKVASSMQVPVAIGRFNRYAQGAMEPNTIPLPPQVMPDTALAAGGVVGAVVNRAPVGVVAAIASYNFPLTNMAGKVAPALAMGNCVILKPAPQDPLNIIDLAAILEEAGVPAGVVSVITGSGAEAGAALVDSPDVDMVSFTGSTQVGIKIAEAGGKTMKRNLMELGGKGAAIVFDDADLGSAIAGIASTWAFHSGQICTAPTRVLCQRGVYDELMGKLTATANALKVGNPLEDDTIVGPLISAVQRDRVEAYIRGAIDQGGNILAGGAERPDIDTGYYVRPTLIADCTPDMTVVQEELFGPVVVAMPFDDMEEAIALANQSPFGLYDYVWSANKPRAFEVAKRLRTGNVGVNTTQRNHETPFGGFKLSGIGRDGGSFGLHCYSEMQSVVWPA
jgi:acyl-CoA reductase-like NAD-dependent aldehyde dehydrogenase